MKICRNGKGKKRVPVKKGLSLSRVFSFCLFFKRVFFLFLMFLGIIHEVFRLSFPIFSSFHLLKSFLVFDGPKFDHFGTCFERKSF